ncbi:uncharacterized protein L201_005140 [Kwoniella dendrophila CBS 6074]|uniref:Zn(2)-C6 fungal-type domain-containing protein n=1 Tax=Kwoniella dendrophila CBS 6074 TaxID=1295534 RepID=A0AAX4JZS5_9TREE
MDYPDSGPSRIPYTPPYDNASNVSCSPSDKGKRKADGQNKPKNLQACDRCRKKKTKCEPIETHRNLCKACQSASLSCTFDLPLTASRTKRIRNGLHQSHGAIWSVDDHIKRSRGIDLLQNPQMSLNRSGSDFDQSTKTRNAFGMRSTNIVASLREGPTSTSYILHSMPTLPLSYLTEYDEINGLSIVSLPPESSDGYILATAVIQPSIFSDPPSHVLETTQSPRWTEVVETLVETFLAEISSLIPIVTREDMTRATPILCHAMAAVAAARRGCPKEIFDCLNHILTQEIQEQDTLSVPTKHNIQTLLVTCLVDELAIRSNLAVPVNVLRTRLSAAIQMAKDLLMDETSMTHGSDAESRIWQCAIVLDQWNAARFGLRPILPLKSLTLDSPQVVAKNDNHFFSHLLSLTLLLSAVLAHIYGPTGITKSRNADIQDIKMRLSIWKRHLPAVLEFDNHTTNLQAGILRLLYISVVFLLYRPFLSGSFIVPPHLDLSLDLQAWDYLDSTSQSALEWVSQLEDPCTLPSFGLYALNMVGLTQYHSYARNRRLDAMVSLGRISETVNKWNEVNDEGKLPLLTSQLQVIPFLYGCAQRVAKEGMTSYALRNSDRGLNPTPGILNKLPELEVVDGVAFFKDASHPEGGYFIATKQAAKEIKDLPPNTIILGGQDDRNDDDRNDGGDANYIHGRSDRAGSEDFFDETENTSRLGHQWESMIASSYNRTRREGVDAN